MSNTLVPIDASSLDRVWQIENQAHSHPWKESMIRDLASRGACHYMLLNDDNVVGYFYAQNVVGEMTLLNFAIDPEVQGQGYGRKLLDGFLDICQKNKAESAWLEVRESNQTAFNLYETGGFNEVDRRRNYYPTSNGKEDAIVMSYFFF